MNFKSGDRLLEKGIGKVFGTKRQGLAGAFRRYRRLPGTLVLVKCRPSWYLTERVSSSRLQEQHHDSLKWLLWQDILKNMSAQEIPDVSATFIFVDRHPNQSVCLNA